MTESNLDAYKFQQEIRKFKDALAPTSEKLYYLQGWRDEVAAELLKMSKQSNQSIERVLLVAICGEMKTQKEQAEFVSRLLLLDLLLE